MENRTFDPDESRDEPWIFIVEGELDPSNEWHADGGWMMLEGIEPSVEVAAMKQQSIHAARARRASMRAKREV